MPRFLFYFLLALFGIGSLSAQPLYLSNSGSGKDTTLDWSHPAWSYQATIYEVNLRQYSAEGNFAGFARSLPRLKKMGIDILWFMPINPIGLKDRKSTESDLGSYYAVKDYYGVNPEFGTFNDWTALVKQCHQMGFKVIMDWVPNHTSPDNDWITKHPDFYRKDSLGNPLIPYDWGDTRQLNYDNREMRDSMTAAMKYWITKTDVDGFRCDVAWNVPDDYWAEAIPQIRALKPVFMLAEGDKPGLNANGFDATYTWSVMNIAYGIYSGKTTIQQLDSVINYNESTFPKTSMRMYFTTNHDENSQNGTEFERFGDAYKTFAIWTFTMDKTIPLVYSGQEEPNKRRLKFYVKDNIDWGTYSLLGFYTQLIRIRHEIPALSSDATYTRVKTNHDDEVFAYMRQKAKSRLLVLLNFSGKNLDLRLDDKNIQGMTKNLFSSSVKKIEANTFFTLTPWNWLVYAFETK